MWEKYNYNLIEWWEWVVKPGIKEEAVLKTREINKSSSGKLNMLFAKQIFYHKLALNGEMNESMQLKLTNIEINEWKMGA